jgi:general stress protein 26
MTSINQNQPEKNHQDLQGPEAIRKLRELIGKAQNCFFCTAGGSTLSSRPMNVRQVDDAGTLWFLSASDSQQNRDVATNRAVKLYFQGSPHSDFLHLVGDATILTDRAKIKELWEPILKTWFTDGMEDPRITVIQFVPTEGYYWDTKHGNLVAGIKMMLGAAIGKTLDDSIEGMLTV